MKLIELGLSPPPERRTNPQQTFLNTFGNWDFLMGGNRSDAGEIVTAQTAMAQSSVAACVRLLSDAIGSMSPILYKASGSGKIEATEHPLHRILSLEPCPDSVAFTTWSSLVGSIALTGNGYLEITRNSAGVVNGLWFLHPNGVTPFRQSDGSIAYRCTEGLQQGQTRTLKADQIIHVPWFSLDGVTGVSVIGQDRNTIGANIAMQKFGARFFLNNATPSGILSIPGKVKPEDKPKMRADWESQQLGTSQHRINILDQDMKFTPITMPNADSQWIEARKLGREEICGLFNIKPSQIGDSARVAGETYAAQQLSFLTDTLRPWLNRIEQELTRKLLVNLPGYSISHDISDRLKTDFKTQMDGFAVGRQWGFYTANEIRRELGQNPYPDPEADLLIVPVNMMSATRLSLPPATPTQVVMNE